HRSMCAILFPLQPPPPETDTLSLHDALPICATAEVQRQRGCMRQAELREPRDLRTDLDTPGGEEFVRVPAPATLVGMRKHRPQRDRKSTRLNSSHVKISYAVFCLKKKNVLHS